MTKTGVFANKGALGSAKGGAAGFQKSHLSYLSPTSSNLSYLSNQQLAALEQLEPLTHLPLSLLSQLPCCKNLSITALLIIGPFLEGHLPSKAGDPSTKRLRMNHSVSREFLDEDKKFGIAAKTLADRRTGWTGSEQPQAAALSRIWSVRALAEAKTHHKPF